jgi:hypothetical protein
VPSAEKLQGVRVERLNSQGKKPDAELAPGADAFRMDVLWIGLEGNPGAVLDRKVFASSLENLSDVLRSERRGRAAAEIDRVNGIKGDAVRSPQGDLGDQMIGEPPPPFRPADQDREIAVGTDGGAEWDVEVEAGVQRRLFQVSGCRRWWITAKTKTSSSSAR